VLVPPLSSELLGPLLELLGLPQEGGVSCPNQWDRYARSYRVRTGTQRVERVTTPIVPWSTGHAPAGLGRHRSGRAAPVRSGPAGHRSGQAGIRSGGDRSGRDRSGRQATSRAGVPSRQH